jgi:uncharacterized membrane protein
MTQQPNQAIPAGERTLTGLAYLLGLIPALVIWVLKKDESPSLRFHAMQAALYDGLVGITAMLLPVFSFLTLSILMIGMWLGTNILADVLEPETPLVYLLLTVLLMLVTSSGIGFAAVLLLGLSLIDLVAALYLFSGQDWRYPMIASWAQKLIQRNPD